MRGDVDTLRKQVDELLKRRPGWKLQAMPTPGLPPVWGFGSGGQVELSVGTDGDSINLYVIAQDADIKLSSTSEIGGVVEGTQAPSVPGPQGRSGRQAKATPLPRLGVAP